MEVITDPNRCIIFGLKPGQKKEGRGFRWENLWWSFDNGRTAFGYGDLDDDDLKRIQDWLTDEYFLTGRLAIFTGWYEGHKDMPHFKQGAAIRISMSAGITTPFNDRLGMYSTPKGA